MRQTNIIHMIYLLIICFVAITVKAAPPLRHKATSRQLCPSLADCCECLPETTDLTLIRIECFYCAYDELDFTTLPDDELSLLTMNASSLLINPVNEFVMNEKLKLNGVEKFQNLRTIQLENLIGIDISHNPFSKIDFKFDLILRLTTNNFQIFYGTDAFDNNANCKASFFEQQQPTEIFKMIRDLSITQLITSNKFNFCPFIFHKADIETLRLTKGLIEFYRLAEVVPTLEISIKQLVLTNGQAVLSASTLEPNVFKNLERLYLLSVSLDRIESDTFQSIKKLKTFSLDLLNINEYLQASKPENGSSWMYYLNGDVNITSLSDCDYIKEKMNNNSRLLLSLISENDIYTDENFCSFRYFPHRSLVFPLIKQQQQQQQKPISCSCTVYFLIQNWQLLSSFENVFNSDSADSVQECREDPDFYKKLNSCNFPSKLKECGDENDGGDLDQILRPNLENKIDPVCYGRLPSTETTSTSTLAETTDDTSESTSTLAETTDDTSESTDQTDLTTTTNSIVITTDTDEIVVTSSPASSSSHQTSTSTSESTTISTSTIISASQLTSVSTSMLTSTSASTSTNSRPTSSNEQTITTSTATTTSTKLNQTYPVTFMPPITTSTSTTTKTSTTPTKSTTTKKSEENQNNNNNESDNKTKEILLGVLIPIGLIAMSGAAGLAYYFLKIKKSKIVPL